MTVYRLILPDWAKVQNPTLPKVIEGQFTEDEIQQYNSQGYNIYYLPNYPNNFSGHTVSGVDIDNFSWVFVDCDLKDGAYASKEQFIEVLGSRGILPTKIVDSGNGVHAYWKISDLDGMSYLRFQRRLMRLFNTDEAVGQLFQLMRVPGTLNTKVEFNPIQCEVLFESDAMYRSEEMNKLLPPITIEDEKYCKHHYDRTFNLNQSDTKITDVMPAKWGQLLLKNKEVKQLWADATDDRSKSDYRLGHLMFANGFSKDEAMAVLMNSNKASERAPVHRISYASNIVEKIWTFEQAQDKEKLELSMSVKDILQRSGDTLKGTRFACHKRIDNTEHGFRLGQVIGLVAGSGVGKTAFALNMFQWFVRENPDYIHFFIPLEQPANEIADRWQTLCGDDTRLHEKVHVMSNYDDNGGFRHLSLTDIKDHIQKFQQVTGKKAGCVVIDHIGALKKENQEGENQALVDICHEMKAFAVQTNTLLVMQSQSSREKAGIGDLEINKDAAYGTVYFEAYCDYLITLWQPLKRAHNDPNCPTVTAFKFCKIRHKKAKRDIIQEDVPYYMYFDSEHEKMRDMTQQEEIAFKYYLPVAINKRKQDRKTEVTEYRSVPYDKV